MSGGRPDLHTPAHDKWDQGGYCNNLVTDDDGCGTVCGYRKVSETARTARTPLDMLTLARDYLDSLLERSTPGPWTAVRVQDQNFAALMPPVLSDYSDGGEGLIDPPDAYLIVALHATAPAIRELLDMESRLSESWRLTVSSDNALVPLALALLSTSHAAQWITDREAK